MISSKSLKYLALFVFVFCIQNIKDIDVSAQNSQEEGISHQKWKEITGDKNYTETYKEIKPRKRKDRKMKTPGWNFNGSKSFVSFLLGAIVVILLALILFLIMKYLLKYFDEKVPQKNEKISFENLKENIHESDFDGLLKHALSEGAYALCIRIYYLKIIKALSDKDLINWKKDKTNHSYVIEMSGKPEGHHFVWLTNVYERVWFGNALVEKPQFAILENHYSDYLKKITAGEA
ncbi:hypothetical protein ES705_10021 [subsurface metagenome]